MYIGKASISIFLYKSGKFYAVSRYHWEFATMKSIIGDKDFSSCPVYIREWYEAISTLSRAENRVVGPHLAADFMNGARDAWEIKKTTPFHSPPFWGKGERSLVQQHRIFCPPNLPTRINPYSLRALSNKRMKRRCLWYYRPSRYFFPNTSFLSRGCIRLSECQAPPAAF